MLTEEQVKSLLVCRIEATAGSCNSYHINHCEGQIRALVAVLTGKPPPPHIGHDILGALDLVGVPYHKLDGGQFAWDEPWLLAYGFQTIKGATPEQDQIKHPFFILW